MIFLMKEQRNSNYSCKYFAAKMHTLQKSWQQGEETEGHFYLNYNLSSEIHGKENNLIKYKMN